MDQLFTRIPEKCGILPGYFYLTSPKVYKTISVVQFLCVVGISLYPCVIMIKGISNNEYHGALKNYTILSIFSEILAASLLTTMLYANVLYPHDFIEIKTHFDKINTILKKQNIVLTENWELAKYLLFHIVIIVLNGISFYIYNGNGWTYTIISIWVLYIRQVEVAIAWRILEDIRLRLKAINSLIRFKDDSNFESLTISNKFQNNILNIIEAHNCITKIIKLFNKLFGIYIILITLWFILELLAIVYGVVADITDHDLEKQYVDIFLASTHVVRTYLFILIYNQPQYKVNNAYRHQLLILFISF